MYVLNVLFDDRFGGSSKRVTEVARYLAAEEEVYTLLCLPRGTGNTAEVARSMGVPVTRVDFERIPRPSDLRRVLRWTVRLLRDVRRFLALYRRENPDLVHVNGAFFLPPALAAKLARVPLAWHLNDTVVPRRVAPIFGTLVCLLADRVLATSEDVARHYSVVGVPHDVMPPPVDPRCFEVAWEPRATGPRRIGLVANWNPLKGVEYFVRSAALVRERLGDDLEVVLVGARLETHAEYAHKIDELIDELGLRPCIREYGFVPSVAPIVAGLDVLVMTSTAEASSMPVLEAMAVGAPVVAADVGGVRDLVYADETNPSGVVVPPRDPESTAQAVLKLLSRSDETARMGSTGRRVAAERFSLQACAHRHLEAYKATTGGS